ncbi:hypothetical protein HWV01_16980 [Moritella sp. 5]|uniref:hypothetical protein n=1 Tax=Moritella sp. 5 TaxID=2746231 RepID=UPI001BA57CC8|nr:hypothetical protein [Moritella sp. 5]QUM81856.1 hypothetical protein HWV01_16980 [Moritella sp. 5]
MVVDKQDLWFAELEKENNERLAQLEEAMIEENRLHAIKAEEIRVKADKAATFNVKHPRLSFLKRYNVIIIMLIGLAITVGFNVSMFIA